MAPKGMMQKPEDLSGKQDRPDTGHARRARGRFYAKNLLNYLPKRPMLDSICTK